MSMVVKHRVTGFVAGFARYSSRFPAVTLGFFQHIPVIRG